MLDVLATPVGILLNAIHEALSSFLISGSGPAWALSIVLLTVVVRLLLFPLFVKQIKSQRRMQELAPKLSELKAKHKGDRETLNAEMMKLYKDNGANPIAGCLPLLLQLPVFFALFTVIREFSTRATEDRFGLSVQQLKEGAAAKVFGAPISAAFNSPGELLDSLGASATTVRVVAALMVVGMGATTFWTQRQMIARAGTTDPQQIMVQKLLLYVLPLSFAVSGAFFPIGVLLYWLTTNVWSMGQQAYVIKRMPPPVLDGKGPASTKGKPGTDDKGKRGAKGSAAPAAASKDALPVEGDAGPSAAVPASAGSSARATSGSTVVTSSGTGRQVAKRQSGTRKNKKNARGRR